MAFNFNFFKGSTMNQVQNSIQYWMNAFITEEDAEKLKQEKEKEIAANVVVEGLEDTEKNESTIIPTPALLCESQAHINLYE